MIQDIGIHKFDNTYTLNKITDEDYVLIFNKNEVLLKSIEGKLELIKYSDIKNINNIDKEDFIYLFKVDEFKFFILNKDNEENINEILKSSKSICRENVSIFRSFEPQWISFASITAKHLYSWYSSNKYCGKCAGKLRIYDKERALICDKCNNILYPTIAPAIIVGVINKDKILLTKYSRGNYKKYALVAGFVEIGESVEDTVKREVMEEVGLKVKNIRYYNSQPWGFSNTILLGYFADLDGDEKVTLEEDELSEGTWFKYDEIPESDSQISLTNTMIEEFRKIKENSR